MKKAFTLIEMLVVVGIIAVLVAASVAGYSKLTGSAEKAKLQELVSQTATALASVYNSDGAWPKVLIEASKGDGLVDEKVAYYLGKRNKISVTLDNDAKRTAGVDRFGVVTPWALAVIKRKGNSADETTVVSESKGGPSTVKDHILHFRLDYDGDGIVRDIPLGGGSVSVRANVAVWSGGKDGKVETYQDGLRKDDAYSWGPGQTKNIN